MEFWFLRNDTIINTTNAYIKIYQETALKRCFSLSLAILLIGCPLFAQDWSAVNTQKPHTAQTEQPKIKKETAQAYRIEAGENVLQERTVAEYNIHGRMIQFSAYQLDSSGQLKLSTQEIIKFDRNGHRIGSMRYNAQKALVWSEELELNEEGLLRKRIQTHYDADPVQRLKTEYRYDQQGRPTTTITFDQNEEVVAEHKRSYNPTGELLHVQAWSFEDLQDRQSKHSLKAHYDYDRQGNLRRAVSEIQKGKTKWKEIRKFQNNYLVEWWQYKNGAEYSHYKHDKRGSLPTQHNYELPPPIPYHSPFEYDDSKRDPLEFIEHQPGRSLSVKTNAKGLPIKEVLREKQKIIMITYFFYDEQDRLMRKKKVYKEDKNIEEVKMEYDPYNNLLKESTYLNDQLTSERSFQYEYYP